MKNSNNDVCAALGAVAVLMTVCCGLPALPVADVGQLSPYVTAVAPVEGSELTEFPRVRLEFSRELAADSVTNESVFVMTATDFETYDPLEWRDLKNDVDDGDVAKLPATSLLAEDGMSITVDPGLADIPAPEPAGYVVVALPTVMSADRYPLNQETVGGVSPVFSSRFWIRSVTPDVGDATDTNVTAADASDDASSSSPTPLADDPAASAEADYPDLSGDDASNAGATDETGAPSAELPTLPDFNRVMITELVTDPQQDHNDTSGGDSVPFNPEPGHGTVGSTDEYIEVVNGTESPVDLTGWSLSMLDGSDVIQSIDEAGWDIYFNAQGDVSSFNAGEVLVLGNPEGDLKNTVTVELRDGAGELRDSVFVEDGNAQSLTDEAFLIDNTGAWGRDTASPGEFNY